MVTALFCNILSKKVKFMQPIVSIITVVRNNAQALEKTLNNLLSLDYPAKELIIIDGASSDSTPQVIERFAEHISYSISEKDSGLYDAMNKGIRAASGEYLWFINAGDTVFSPSTLQNIFSPGENPTQLADIYYGETLVCTPDGSPLGLRRKPLPHTLSWHSLSRGMVVCHQSFIVRRNIAPLYDLSYRYVADIEWVIESLKAARSIVFTHQIMSCFETGGISTRHRNAGLRERWHIMCHHYGLARTVTAHIGFLFDIFTPTYRPYKQL